MSSSSKPIVLHLGEPIKYNHDLYDGAFTERFQVVRNDCPDRASFIQALKDKKFGDFAAIFRPHFQSGGEMGRWDDELVALLPPGSVRIFASAGAGYDWADVDALGRRGIWYANGAGASDDAVSDTGLYLILSVFRHFTRAQLAARTTFHATLPGLLAAADCVSVHTPLTPQTRDLLDAAAFAAMKPGVRVINTARGPVVHEDALIAALQSGHVAAAALDVHYHEPQVSPVLAAMENVTLTPHVGGGALNTRINFERNAMENILAVVGARGERIGAPRTPVNRQTVEAALASGAA
ncbi:D-mandelate dehydrogenase [Niveomyces insectorum RCEF 264]|uniref:D-mandelate dehydrogenase n=1 Tax=Niveomyces insectorum RCEF 264 TaxID=1081102 RepID=A0A167S0L5_9HYPO|nr:D-mandelate dehydrogenase [Niveomyces insectorum RCEF 264]